MTERESVRIKEVWKHSRPEIERAVHAARRLFRGGVPSFLDPDRLEEFKKTWVAGHINGGVAAGERQGFALRSDDFCGLAFGLLAPGHFRLAALDLPNYEADVARYLGMLVARTSDNRGEFKTLVRKAADTAVADVGSFEALARRAWALRERSIHLYESALLGDFATCRQIVEAINDQDSRDEAIRVIASLRVVWAAADVHRVAAHGNPKTQRTTVPWFLRPFIQKYTAAEYIKLMRTMKAAIDRIFRAARHAEGIERDRARVTNKGNLLFTIENVAAPLEEQLSPQDRFDLRSVREPIARGAENIMREIDIEFSGKPATASLHQWRYGFDERAALYFCAYRFAEDEEAMLKVIAEPDNCAPLWDSGRRSFPDAISESCRRRADKITDAYRRAILRDLSLADDSHADRHVSQWMPGSRAAATAFLQKLGSRPLLASGGVDPEMLEGAEVLAANMFDLSHRVRNGFSTGQTRVTNSST